MKEHSYFEGIDWQQVYLQKYTPPLTPPRGEVNAADAFDIGSFDEEDTKGIKVIISYQPIVYDTIFDYTVLHYYRSVIRLYTICLNKIILATKR